MKVIAWLGLGFLAMGVAFSFYASWALLNPDPPQIYPTGGAEVLYVDIYFLDILGTLLLLIGGLIAKPRALWLPSIIIGFLQVVSLYGFVIIEVIPMYKWSKPILGTLGFFLAPGFIMVFEGFLLRFLYNKKQKKIKDGLEI